MKKFLFLVAAMLFMTGTSHADYSPIRIVCRSQDAGARISVNGTYKGDCSTDGPLDVFVPVGPVLVEAKKMPDAIHEQYFSQQFTAKADVAKKVIVVLSQPQLTKAAQAAKAAKEKADREAEARIYFDKQLAAAKDGDMTAMEKVASLYSQGKGVKQDSNEAHHWQQELAAAKKVAAAEKDLQGAYAGKIEAMEAMIQRYRTGDGVGKDDAAADKWREKVSELKAREEQKRLAAEKRSRAIRNQQALETELAKVSYRKNQKALDDWVDHLNHSTQHNTALNAGGALLVSVVSLPAMAGATVLDVISSPSRMMEKSKIKKKYEAHAGAWAKPNSMLAKAYSREPHRESSEKPVLYAAR